MVQHGLLLNVFEFCNNGNLTCPNVALSHCVSMIWGMVRKQESDSCFHKLFCASFNINIKMRACKYLSPLGLIFLSYHIFSTKYFNMQCTVKKQKRCNLSILVLSLMLTERIYQKGKVIFYPTQSAMLVLKFFGVAQSAPSHSSSWLSELSLSTWERKPCHASVLKLNPLFNFFFSKNSTAVVQKDIHINSCFACIKDSAVCSNHVLVEYEGFFKHWSPISFFSLSHRKPHLLYW